MKAFLKWFALTPILAIVLVFAVVNRQPVEILFDPFGNPKSHLAVTLPLFLALLATTAIGVLLGGIVTWFGQARHRRDARAARAEVARLRTERARSLPAAPSDRNAA